MPDAQVKQLTRREREVMDIVYAHESVCVADVQAALVDHPSYSATRMLLQRLHKKGRLEAAADGPRYLYRATTSKQSAGRAALSGLLKTFFDGSPSKALSALIDDSEQLSDQELAELDALVDAAKQRRGSKESGSKQSGSGAIK